MSTKIEAIINSSRSAESDQDWEIIDEQIQTLTESNQDEAANFILPFAKDPDSRVRDTTATILGILDIKDTSILGEATNKMIFQATEDEDVFASGRAASFLLKHQSNPSLEGDIGKALGVFTQRVVEKGWQEELINNIPNESLHQLLVKSK